MLVNACFTLKRTCILNNNCVYKCCSVIHPHEMNCKIFCSDLEILFGKIDSSVFHKLFSKKKCGCYPIHEYRYVRDAMDAKTMRGCTLTNKQTNETRVDVWESIPVDNKQACPRVSYSTLLWQTIAARWANFCLPRPRISVSHSLHPTDGKRRAHSPIVLQIISADINDIKLKPTGNFDLDWMLSPSHS